MARRSKPRQKKSTATYEAGDEPNRCRAMSKRTRNRCGNSVVQGRAVCRYHGGLGGRPPVNGRYSMAMGRFREAYESSLDDPSLLDLRETLAVLDVVVRQAAERAGSGDSIGLRERALEMVRGMSGEEDPEKLGIVLRDLEALLESGMEEDAALEALADAAERLARRQEKAVSLHLDAAQAINARELVAVLSLFADIVLEEAPRDVAAKIIRRIDTDVLGTGTPAARISAGLGG